jgi:hypothetical protein
MRGCLLKSLNHAADLSSRLGTGLLLKEGNEGLKGVGLLTGTGSGCGRSSRLGRLNRDGCDGGRLGLDWGLAAEGLGASGVGLGATPVGLGATAVGLGAIAVGLEAGAEGWGPLEGPGLLASGLTHWK